jgi:hypothetical protein
MTDMSGKNVLTPSTAEGSEKMREDLDLKNKKQATCVIILQKQKANI